MATLLRVEVRLERKQADLPAFVVVPAAAIARWELSSTTTVEAKLDGVHLGRRSLQPLDERGWFLELRREHLVALGKDVGDRAELSISLASAALPDELQSLIEADPAARARWEACTDAQKRMLREHVLEAKKPETRARRARRALLP